MPACYESPMSTITITIHSSNQIFLRSTTLPRTSIPQTMESRLFNLLSLHLIRSLNGSSTTWRALPQQPQKMLVAKLRPTKQQGEWSTGSTVNEPRSWHCLSRNSTRSPAWTKTRGAQRDTSKSTSEMLSAIHATAATGWLPSNPK